MKKPPLQVAFDFRIIRLKFSSTKSGRALKRFFSRAHYSVERLKTEDGKDRLREHEHAWPEVPKAQNRWSTRTPSWVDVM